MYRDPALPLDRLKETARRQTRARRRGTQARVAFGTIVLALGVFGFLEAPGVLSIVACIVGTLVMARALGAGAKADADDAIARVLPPAQLRVELVLMEHGEVVLRDVLLLDGGGARRTYDVASGSASRRYEVVGSLEREGAALSIVSPSYARDIALAPTPSEGWERTALAEFAELAIKRTPIAAKPGSAAPGR